jgi:hypothetical protein
MPVFLAGGGSPEQESQVWAAAFRGVRRVLYWPLALPSERHHEAQEWLHDSLRRLGIGAEVTTWTGLADHRADELGAHDLLFVGGGTTSRLARQVHEHGFADAVRAFVLAGGGYYGGSAGAILAGDDITLAAHVDGDAEADGVPGLGLLRGPAVHPHADTLAVDPRLLAGALGRPVLALDEDSGVRVDADGVTAIGPGRVRLFAGEGRQAPGHSSHSTSGAFCPEGKCTVV